MKHWVALVVFIILLMPAWAMAGVGDENGAVTLPETSVHPPSPDTPTPMTDIHDILPPVQVGTDFSWLLPVLLALVAILIVAGLWWWWKRRKKGIATETIVPELPPEMIALRDLDEIDDVSLMDGKTFYFRLSSIIRQYAFRRFGVGAPEMTTEEFLPCIDRLAIDGDLAMRLKLVSRAMDPVKFGGQTAVEQQMATDLVFAREFVKKTTPSGE